MPLAKYAKLLDAYEQRVRAVGRERAGPAPYLQEDESLFADYEDRLLGDVAHFPFRPYAFGDRAAEKRAEAAGVQTETAFWMGPANARTGIHWDSIDAILHQVHGTKQITLWPPSARDDLYVSSKYNHGAELSDVDAAAPNLTRFPRFQQAKALSLLLTAGSALFLPAGWWHAVASLDTTISLALRSQGACERRAAAADDALLWLHTIGLYKRGNCVCHRDSAVRTARASEDEDEALDRSVQELMRAAGVELDDGDPDASDDADADS